MRTRVSISRLTLHKL